MPLSPIPNCTLRVNFIVPQKSDGSRNFQEDDEENALVWRKALEVVNRLYANLKDPKDESCYKGDLFIPDTYIRFVLNEVIYVQDDSLWNADNGNQCPKENNWWLNALDKKVRADPKTANAINIYFPNGPHDEYGKLPDGSDYKGRKKSPCSELPTFRDLDRSSRINLAGSYNKYLKMRYVFPNDSANLAEGHTWESRYRSWHYNTIAHTMAHELGHSLGLMHNNPHHGRNKCEYALMNQRHGKPHNYVQPDEIGKMHRSLRMTNIRDFNTEDFYSTVALEIADTAHIDISHKSYEDIIVKEGGELTLSCELLMPEAGSLMVEPGGKLIIRGGVIEGRGRDGAWGGIVLLKERGWFWKKKRIGTLDIAEAEENRPIPPRHISVRKMPR